MRTVARAYSTKRECSVQEVLYPVMPELWLRKAFPKVIFLNSNIPERRYRIFENKTELDEFPEDSTDVFQRNMLDHYIDRPDASFQSGKYKEVDSSCFAEFLGSYYVQSKQKSYNDSQLVVLDDELIESQHSDFHYNKTIHFMSSKQKLKRRKVRAVLRYHVPNANRNAEGYAHHMLFSFYPFRDKEDLKHPSFSGTYLEKLQNPEVIDMVHRNTKIMEPFSKFVDAALLNISEYVRNQQDPFSQQENEFIENKIKETVDDILENKDPAKDTVHFKVHFKCKTLGQS